MTLEQIVNSFLTYLRHNNTVHGGGRCPEQLLKEETSDFSNAVQYATQWWPQQQQTLTADSLVEFFKKTHEITAKKNYHVKLLTQDTSHSFENQPGTFRRCESCALKQIPTLDELNAADLQFLQHGRMPKVINARLQMQGVMDPTLKSPAEKARLMHGAPAWLEANSVLQITAYIYTHCSPMLSFYFFCGYYKKYFSNSTPKDVLFFNAIKQEIIALGEETKLSFDSRAPLTEDEKKALDLVYISFLSPEKISKAFSDYARDFIDTLKHADMKKKHDLAVLCVNSFQSYIRIHPFLDANYRTFSIIMNAIFFCAGYGYVNFHDLELKKTLHTPFGELEPNKELAIGLLERCLDNTAVQTSGPPTFLSQTTAPGKSLRKAAGEGKIDDLTLLLKQHHELIDEVTVSQGRTALHWAVEKEHPRCVTALLEYGARYDIEDKQRQTAVDLCVTKDNATVAETFVSYLLSQYAKKDRDPGKALRSAAHEGNLEGVKLLVLTKTVDINAAGPETGQTALHRAVRKKDVQMTHFLITQGADVSIQDKDGHTAGFYAQDNPDLLACLDQSALVSISGPKHEK